MCVCVCVCVCVINFPEVVTLVLTKSASCWGVQRVIDLAKFQVWITKGEAQAPLLFCSHDYCSLFRFCVCVFFFFCPLTLLFCLILSLLVLLHSRFIISALSLISGVSAFLAVTFLSPQARPRQGAVFCCCILSFSYRYFCCRCWWWCIWVWLM